MPVFKLRRVLISFLVVLDGLMLAAAVLVAMAVRFGDEARSPLLLFAVPIVLLLFWAQKLYRWQSVFWTSDEFLRVINAVTGGIGAAIIIGYTLKFEDVSRAWTLLSWAFAILFISASRMVFPGLVFFLRRRGLLAGRTLLVGGNDEARLLAKRAKGRTTGLYPIGFVARRSAGKTAVQDLPFLGVTKDIKRVIEEHRVDAVIIASSALGGTRKIMDLLRSLRGVSLDIYISSGLFEIITSRVSVNEIAGIPMTTVKQVGIGRLDKMIKRAFDCAASALILIVFSPLFVLIALAIKATSPGRVLFKQQRVGKDGCLFFMYKFRSMIAGSDESLHRATVGRQIANDGGGELQLDGDKTFKNRADPRITGLGRWMRKFSLDELPQLFNVFYGEMSLVGPRPPIPYEVEMYDPWMKRRLDAVPGMTGLWQVSGRADLPYREMVKLDLFYIENWSLALDLSILLKTMPTVLFPKGAY